LMFLDPLFLKFFLICLLAEYVEFLMTDYIFFKSLFYEIFLLLISFDLSLIEVFTLINLSKSGLIFLVLAFFFVFTESFFKGPTIL